MTRRCAQRPPPRRTPGLHPPSAPTTRCAGTSVAAGAAPSLPALCAAPRCTRPFCVLALLPFSPPPPPRARELWTWASWTWATSAAWTAWPSRRPCFGVRRPWLLSPFPCAAPFCFCFLPSSLLGCSFLRCCQTECWLRLSAVSGGGAGRGRVCRGGGRGEWLALVVRSVAYRLCLLRWTLAHPVAHEPFVTDSF